MRSDRIALAALAVLAALLVGLGLHAVGGPEKARQQKRDTARAEALSDLARCVVQLPAPEFDALPVELVPATVCTGFGIWRDDGTGASFRLVRGEGGAFSVCTTFENPASVRRYAQDQSFDAATGCITARREG